MSGGGGGGQSVLETPILFLALVFAFFLVVTLGFEFVRGKETRGQQVEKRERRRGHALALLSRAGDPGRPRLNRRLA